MIELVSAEFMEIPQPYKQLIVVLIPFFSQGNIGKTFE